MKLSGTFQRLVAGALVSAAFFMPSLMPSFAEAKTIGDFAKTTVAEQDQYIKHTLGGTFKVLGDAGRADDAMAAAKLFYRTEQEKLEKKQTVGMTDFFTAIKDHYRRGDLGFHVEDAMIEVLNKHGIRGIPRDKLIQTVENWDPNFRFADQKDQKGRAKGVSYEQQTEQPRLVQ